MVIAGGTFFVAALFLWAVPRSPAWLGDATAVLTAIGAGAAAAFDRSAPTGTESIDVVLRTVAGAAVVLGLSVLPPKVALGLAVAASALEVIWGGSVVSADAAAVGTAAACVATSRVNRPLQALTGALLVIGAVQGTAGDAARGPAAAIVVIAIAVAASHRLQPRPRRTAHRAMVAALVFALAAAGVGALVALSSRSDLRQGADLAAQGLELLGEDDAAAQVLLARAATAFQRAEANLGAWWAQPARGVPGVAQHVRAASTMAGVGHDLVTSAAAITGSGRLEAVSIDGGTVDLGAVRAAGLTTFTVGVDLERADARLEAVDSPILVGTVGEPLRELRARVADARDVVGRAAEVLEILPALLGGEGERRYLVLVQNPAEARGSGGLPGNYAELVADGGRLRLERSGRLVELIDGGVPAVDRVVDIDADQRALFAAEDVGIEWQNTTSSPDFEEVADLVAQLYPQSGGGPVDGVLSIDPFAIDALLAIVGPVQLEGLEVRHGEAAALFLHDQYVLFQDRGTRVDILDEVVDATWTAFTSTQIGGPRRLIDRLGPMVDARHLQFTSFEEREHAVLADLGLTGALPEPEVDGVGVVLLNASLNKLDWFVDRRLSYDATVDLATARIRGTLRVEVVNRVPPEGEPRVVAEFGGETPSPDATAPGEYAALAYFYTALPPVAVRLDGAPVVAGVGRDGDWFVTVLQLRIGAGGTAAVEIDVDGPVAGDRYDFVAVRQPTINVDDLAVVVEITGSVDPHTIERGFELDKPVHFGMSLRD